MPRKKGDIQRVGAGPTTTITVLSRMLNLSQRRVWQLVNEGIIPKPPEPGAFLVEESVQGYIGYLQERAAPMNGRAGSGLALERSRLAKEQADARAMQNAVMRKELAPVVVLREVLTRTGAQVAGILDGIPAAVKRRGGVTPEGVRVIEDEISRARMVAASVTLDDLHLPPVNDE